MIRPQPFPTNPSYQAVIQSLLQMHRFTVDGQDESEEAELLRESMNEPWEALSKTERARVTGLSKDLYEISDSTDRNSEPMNPQAQRKLNEVYEARERGEWDRALDLLRRWGKYIAAPLVSYLRGFIWRAAGDAATAAVFFEHAFCLEPDNEKFQAVLLDILKTANPTEASARAEVILRNVEIEKPAVILLAADISFRSVKGSYGFDAVAAVRRLIPILQRTLAKVESEEDGGSATLKCMALSLLAECFREVGDVQLAYGCYSRAIQLDPTNDMLFTARGMLVYGTDPNAPADFERAIELSSPLVWPYLWLAHHYLTNNRFDDCRSVCERALRKPASKRVESELCEFLAISLTGLGYPEHVIRRAFENAIRVDPSNERASRNLQLFENASAAHAPHPKNWERRSESSLRTFADEENAWPREAFGSWQTMAGV